MRESSSRHLTGSHRDIRVLLESYVVLSGGSIKFEGKTEYLALDMVCKYRMRERRVWKWFYFKDFKIFIKTNLSFDRFRGPFHFRNYDDALYHCGKGDWGLFGERNDPKYIGERWNSVLERKESMLGS